MAILHEVVLDSWSTAIADHAGSPQLVPLA